jgi:hypothetical protein
MNGERLIMLFLFPILLLMTTCQNRFTDADNSIPQELKAIAQSRRIPADFSITYDDMHSLWGGTRIVIDGTGNCELQERTRGDRQPQIVKKTIDRERVFELIELLVEQQAWEQRTPERAPAADESKATLTISVGKQSSRVWEWFNDMKKNQRLIQIQTKMSEIVKKA